MEVESARRRPKATATLLVSIRTQKAHIHTQIIGTTITATDNVLVVVLLKVELEQGLRGRRRDNRDR